VPIVIGRRFVTFRITENGAGVKGYVKISSIREWAA
jgi:hypothetical protein